MMGEVQCSAGDKKRRACKDRHICITNSLACDIQHMQGFLCLHPLSLLLSPTSDLLAIRSRSNATPRTATLGCLASLGLMP